ncbi:PhzF family phenazine biosynthesis protein [Deinococcus alpinitundrae]|uniref:PhzF family phenazine biosynthesis protein n=1 Tax=Deinococcus alpinitundrae TaxID=468913 RepID=UPI001379FD9F|nr:PhzF family phenazine biosynthesis protein [Deinococcus alpinitundrae]
MPTSTQLPLTQPVAVVDAFTSRAFRGNPAGVCLLAAPAPAEWMQLVARELNHAESAFVWPLDTGFLLRWFTPTTEVDLCGHGTLAAAHALWESGALPPHETVHFQTPSGALSARQVDLGWIELDFPTEVAEETTPPLDMAELLGVPPLWVGKNRLDYLVELASAAQVRALRPDLSRFGPLGLRGVIVTAAGDGDHDMVSRGFFPNIGIPEDPVTGSAHCALTPYWAAKLGRRELSAYQASARGGELRLRLEGQRVKLLGQAVTTLRGFIAGPETLRSSVAAPASPAAGP